MKIRLALALTILLALFLPVKAYADVTSYTSGFELQNLDNATANVTIIFYNESDGSQAATITDTIPALGNKTYYPLSGVPAGFAGSAVVQSDTRVVAIVNILGNNGAYGASYDGFTAGAITVNVPLVMKDNYGISTWFNVQNTGASDASVTVTYKPGSCTESATVKSGAAHTFDQSTNSCLSAGFVGAASVSGGTQEVAVSVIQVTSSSRGLKPNLLAYNGFTSAATNPILPLVTSGYYSSGTGIQIQNTGATSTNVTISYKPSTGFPGAACTETKAVPAGTSVTFGFPNMPAACYTNAGQAGSAAFVGSGQVSANSASMPLVAVVNQVTVGAYNAGAYGSFDASNGTSHVSLPLIMDRNYGLFTGFSIANVGTQPTNVNCTFTGTSYTVTASNLAPGSALTDVQLNKIAASYVGSGTCTASGGDAKIVGIVNELNPGSIIATQDGLSVYEGLNY
jgi:hypothetical protein